MQTVRGSTTTRIVAEVVVLAFMGLVAFAASKTGLAVILFPELVALSHDVINRPQGKWASQPLRLIVTPTVTAALGLFLTRHLSYNVLSIALIVALSLAFIRLYQICHRAGYLRRCTSSRSGRAKLVLPSSHLC